MGELRARILHLRSNARAESKLGRELEGGPREPFGDLADTLKFLGLETAALWTALELIADQLDALNGTDT